MAVDLFVCYYDPYLAGERFFDGKDLKEARQKAIDEQLGYLFDLARPYSKEGLSINLKAAWDTPLYEGIVREALRSNACLVLKDTHYHSALSRAMFTNTDWQLIRSCPVPLWLVKPDQDFVKPSIVAAVDPINEHEKPALLDNSILSEAFKLARGLGGLVHAVHTYDVTPAIAAASGAAFGPVPIATDGITASIEQAHSSAFTELADRFDVSPVRRHLKVGSATELLPAISRELSADLIIMGAVARSRLQRVIVGSTAERTLDHLPCDVLIMKSENFVSPVTFESEPKSASYAERDANFDMLRQRNHVMDSFG